LSRDDLSPRDDASVPVDVNCPSRTVPGFLGMAGDMRSRIDALGDPETGIPASWTPEHVGARLIEAYGVLARSGGRILPARFGNGWPAMVHEFADMVDAQARLLAEKEKAQVRAARPTSDELSRMEEALRWPMDHLDGRPLAADALMFWTYAKATGRDMDGMLHHRKKAATALAEEMMWRANAPAHRNPETGEISDTRDAETLARNAHRVLIAREVAARTNAALAAAPVTRHAEIRLQAQAAFRAKLRDAGCLPLSVKPHEAVPGRVLNRRTLDRQRKIAMEVVADRLRRAGVVVR
jgi:hypothetical protein